MYHTTVDSAGKIIKQTDLKNVDYNFINYFNAIHGKHKTTVESTMTWCWLNDLLSSLKIPLVLAHAKYVKAIAYSKVKTDKVDSHTLAQLLRMNFIPEAYLFDHLKWIIFYFLNGYRGLFVIPNRYYGRFVRVGINFLFIFF